MKIALIGATGMVGSKLLQEALDRGHHVMAIVRNPQRLPSHSRLEYVQIDTTESAALARAVAGHDVVISAFNPGRDETGAATQSIIDGVKQSKVGRLLVVGGAGTLETAPGQRLIDQPDFPSEWKEGALRTARFLEQLRKEDQLDWVFLSPAAKLVPGKRTGKYRAGRDQLLVNENGESVISIEDYAVAMLDEAEHPRHHHARFCVAY